MRENGEWRDNTQQPIRSERIESEHTSTNHMTYNGELTNSRQSDERELKVNIQQQIR